MGETYYYLSYFTVLLLQMKLAVWRCCERKQLYLQTNSNVESMSCRESVSEPVVYSTLFRNEYLVSLLYTQRCIVMNI